ncbi:MAG: hemolysin XhlA family protein [Cyanobacteria bacterium P01_G01_bin.49]
MSEPVTVTYSLEEVLKRMEGKLDNLQKDVTDLKVGQAKLTEKVEGIDNRLNAVEGTQKNQVWALIFLLAGAIATTGARLFFAANP